MMNDSILPDAWNRITFTLMQALLGAVSPNFRMVALANEGGVWKLKFVLEAESEVDRSEIEDIAVEFEALQDSSVRYEVETTITAADSISWPSPPTIVVYRRRET